MDALRLASHGLRARPLRVVLAALGIAIGIGAMIAVVGISASSRAELNRTLDLLGTNLLTIQPGTSFFGEQATLPDESVVMIGRITDVESVSAIGSIAGANVYRHDRIPAVQSGGLSVYAARIDLTETLSASLSSGRWLNEATASFPAVVLGSRAASRLGISAPDHDVQIWLRDRWFSVIGVLEPIALAPILDSGAFVGWAAAEHYLEAEVRLTTVFVRTGPGAVEPVRALLGRTANPAQPNEVDVSRPSDALAARAAADLAFTGLLLGLGSVALLVGGIGIVNTMVISVLERRGEIGLRRSQGATRGHIRIQFFCEALLLSAFGGMAGVVIGISVTSAYAHLQSWPVSLPPWSVGGGMLATLAIGALGGVYPALRAARLSPTEALSAT
jgi:putative ABC transport system permease protein